jgi:hypothetical protein
MQVNRTILSRSKDNWRMMKVVMVVEAALCNHGLATVSAVICEEEVEEEAIDVLMSMRREVIADLKTPLTTVVVVAVVVIPAAAITTRVTRMRVVHEDDERNSHDNK